MFDLPVGPEKHLDFDAAAAVFVVWAETYSYPFAVAVEFVPSVEQESTC